MKKKKKLNAMNSTLLSFKDTSHVTVQMLHHLRIGSSVVPQTFFKRLGIFKSSTATHLLTDNVNYNMCVLRKPFIFMLRHKLAYEQDSSLTATSKGLNEQVDTKRALTQFKAL